MHNHALNICKICKYMQTAVCIWIYIAHGYKAHLEVNEIPTSLRQLVLRDISLSRSLMNKA